MTRRTRKQRRPNKVSRRSQKFAITAFPSFYADQPPFKMAKLEYYHAQALSSIPSISIFQREFRANDLYDPDYAVGGHQPYGFDQIMSQYHHFTVLYSKCDIECQDSAEARNVKYHIWQTNEPGQLASTYASSGVSGLLEERPHSAAALINTAADNADKRLVSLSFDATKVFGKSAADMIGDASYHGDETHSPTEEAFFAIGGYHPLGTPVTLTDATITVHLTYWAVFTEPKRMSSS